jgi:hypothetical protein
MKIIVDTGLDNISAISTSDFMIVGGNQSFSITNLLSNWNFFSLPFNSSIHKSNLFIEYDNFNYNWSEAVVHKIVSDYIFDWNRFSQTYIFSDILQSGYGFWVYSYEDCEIWIENIIVPPEDPYITHLETGWNIVSIPSYENVSKSELLIDDAIWSYAVSQGWISDFIYGWNRPYQYYEIANTLMPSYSYWFYAYQPCTLKRII